MIMSDKDRHIDGKQTHRQKIDTYTVMDEQDTYRQIERHRQKID